MKSIPYGSLCPWWPAWVRLNRSMKSNLYFTEFFPVAFLTQVFYCYRIAILTKSKYAVTAIILVREKLFNSRTIFPLKLWPCLPLQLSISQLGSAIEMTLQTRAAMFLPDILGTKMSLITIGVWFTQLIVVLYLIMIFILDLGDNHRWLWHDNCSHHGIPCALKLNSFNTKMVSDCWLSIQIAQNARHGLSGNT